MLRTRIKEITYANGITLVFPQVRLLLFWRYFHRNYFKNVLFSWRYFFRDTVLFRTKNAIGVPSRIFIGGEDYVDNGLRQYYKSYVCYVNSHKIKKIEVINKDYSDFIVYINHDKQE